MAYHEDAVNSKKKSVKTDDTGIPCLVSGKEQRRMLAACLDKIILTQVMRKENN